jgi:Domain of unknown function (DUF4188)
MKSSVNRQTVDLDSYPDLVVIYLGMQVRTFRGFRTLLSFGPKLKQALTAKPVGLLHHEDVIWSIFPPHLGFRQYWQDFDSLESWSRSLPHKEWWQAFLRDSGGTGFWHETYFKRGGMEAVYDDLSGNFGLAAFAPVKPAKGPMFSARTRANHAGEAKLPPPVPESDT